VLDAPRLPDYLDDDEDPEQHCNNGNARMMLPLGVAQRPPPQQQPSSSPPELWSEEREDERKKQQQACDVLAAAGALLPVLPTFADTSPSTNRPLLRRKEEAQTWLLVPAPAL